MNLYNNITKEQAMELFDLVEKPIPVPHQLFRESRNGKHPVQPIYMDNHGVVRFKSNLIIEYLLDNSNINLNTIASISFPQNDREQLSQLIGYSVSGFGGLSHVSNQLRDRCDIAVSKLISKKHQDESSI